MENRVEKILTQIRAAIVELEGITGVEPTKVVLGIEVYTLIHNYLTLCYLTVPKNRDFATLFNIPLTVDYNDVNRISVCIERNVNIREEVF